MTIEKWVLEFDMGDRMALLISLGVCGTPSLGLGSRWIWSFHLVCLLSALRSGVKKTYRTTKVCVVWFHCIMVCMFPAMDIILLIPIVVLWLQVIGMWRRCMVRSATASHGLALPLR